jgi:glutamate-1-semialdehyde 2,1-aminomutase
MSQTSSNPADTLSGQARSVLAGGVSASMRIHPYLGRPFYMSRGDGSRIYDLEGREYIDFNVSNGAAILGHHHPATQEAVMKGLDAGMIAAAETPYHEQLARILTEIIPSAERVRFASTGSEVTLVAMRLARHVTGRSRILKFEGHFHGLTEPYLYKQDAGEVVPSSGGVLASGADDTLIVPWNDVAAFEAAVARHGDTIAAVICEPVHYNAGCIPPSPGFLELLRERTSQAGIVLIFDEVLSGFRMELGGVQELSGVTPDLSTFAKALANGMPLSALVGRADLMEQLAPGGPVAHSGTYSGHLLSVLAAIATLEELRRPGAYDTLNENSQVFYRDMQEIFDRHDLPVVVQGLGARFGLYFGRRDPVTTYTDAIGHNHELNKQFTVGCLERGVYFHAYTGQGAPGHAGFSFAHSREDFSRTLEAINDVAADMPSRH